MDRQLISLGLPFLTDAVERWDQTVIKVPPGLDSVGFWEAKFIATVYATEGQVGDQKRENTKKASPGP